MHDLPEAVNWDFYDLRDPLRAAPDGCPYQPYNLHWLESGHEVVSDFLAHKLSADGYLPVIGD